MDKTIINDFFKFLKENNAYESYRKYRAIDAKINSETILEIFNAKPSFFLSLSFVWENTKEGADYWSKLSIKWSYYVYQKNKSI